MAISGNRQVIVGYSGTGTIHGGSLSMTSRGLSIWNYGIIAGIIANCTVVTFLVSEIAKRADNHWGWETNEFMVLPACVLVGATAGTIISKKCSARVMLCLWLCLLVLTTVWACDHWNLLVEYDRWLERGMPGKWERTRAG